MNMELMNRTHYKDCFIFDEEIYDKKVERHGTVTANKN